MVLKLSEEDWKKIRNEAEMMQKDAIRSLIISKTIIRKADKEIKECSGQKTESLGADGAEKS
jgi:hypothetical protein